MRIKTIALLILVAPALAAAQTNTAEDIDTVRRDARIHVGPFYVTPTLLLKELGIDSNVFNAAGEQVSDFTITVAPKLDVWVPVARRALFQVTSATDLVWYAKYDSESSVDPQVGGRAEIYLHRITLFGEGQVVNTRQRMNYEIDVRARQLRSDYGGGVEVGLTPRFSLEAAARRGRTEFDADAFFDGHSLQRTLNHETTGFRGVARYRLTPLTTIAVRYERQSDEFVYSPLRDSKSYRVMPGIEFKPLALIKGTAYVGYRRFTPSHGGSLPEFSGIVADLGLSYSMLDSTTFTVSYRRDLTYSYEELQPFFVNTGVGFSARRALGRRLDLLGSIDRYSYDYQDLLTGPLAPAVVVLTERVDTTWNYAASLGYRIGEGRIGFGLSYWRRHSPLTLREYDNLRFGTTATYGF